MNGEYEGRDDGTEGKGRQPQERRDVPIEGEVLQIVSEGGGHNGTVRGEFLLSTEAVRL